MYHGVVTFVFKVVELNRASVEIIEIMSWANPKLLVRNNDSALFSGTLLIEDIPIVYFKDRYTWKVLFNVSGHGYSFFVFKSISWLNGYENLHCQQDRQLITTTTTTVGSVHTI